MLSFHVSVNSEKRSMRATRKLPKPVEKGPSPASPLEAKKTDSFPIVGIGASAGGLDAFKELLAALPENGGMAYVLIPHLDPDHQSVLTEILSRVTKMPVAQVQAGVAVARDHVYVIPPNKTLGISGGKFVLSEREHARSPHLPIDYFFAALAADQGDRSVGIVLSGTA